jgi:hypothetical protein
METVIILALIYLAIGAVLFAHPPAPAIPNDFHWRGQIGVFRESLPLVMSWPLALWRLAADRT